DLQLLRRGYAVLCSRERGRGHEPRPERARQPALHLLRIRTHALHPPAVAQEVQERLRGVPARRAQPATGARRGAVVSRPTAGQGQGPPTQACVGGRRLRSIRADRLYEVEPSSLSDGYFSVWFGPPALTSVWTARACCSSRKRTKKGCRTGL